MVVAQPLLDDRPLFRAEAELPGGTARIADGQHPCGMTLSCGAHGTTGAMTNDAVEQRAADDVSGKREGGGEFGTLAENRFIIHLYR